MNVLLTGHDGFIGSSLGPAIERRGHRLVRAELDLHDWPSIERAVSGSGAEAVIHLAGLSHVPTCEADPGLAYKTNVNGTAMLIEALVKHAPSARVLFASTAQVYAAPTRKEGAGEVVFDESRALAPQNVYARTKRAGEVLLADSGLAHAVLRLFNHTHRTQSPDFFLPHLYKTLSGGATQVPVGNLSVVRDIGALPDLIDAFVRVLEGELVGVFNVCSGHGKHLGKLAATLAAAMGVPADFVVEPSRVRADEPRAIVGSHDRLTNATGWSPSCRTEADLVRLFLQG